MIILAGAVGFEPTPAVLDAATQVLKTCVLPLHYAPIKQPNAYIWLYSNIAASLPALYSYDFLLLGYYIQIHVRLI